MNEIAVAKKCLADVEARLARAKTPDRSALHFLVERSRNYRDDMQAVLESHDLYMKIGQEMIAQHTAEQMAQHQSDTQRESEQRDSEMAQSAAETKTAEMEKEFNN